MIRHLVFSRFLCSTSIAVLISPFVPHAAALAQHAAHAQGQNTAQPATAVPSPHRRHRPHSSVVARQLALSEGTPSAAASSAVSSQSQIQADIAKAQSMGINLSAQTLDLASRLGFLDELESFEKLRRKDADNGSPSIELLHSRQQLLETVLTLSYQVSAFAQRVDSDIARADALSAYLAQKRDKAIRLNSIANFISGGITGIVSGSLFLGDVNHIAPDIIDTSEGAAQASLALLALKQQSGEKRLERGIPNVLSVVVDPEHRNKEFYPEIVLTYLNSPPVNSKTGLTRREEILNKWTQMGFCLNRRRPRSRPDTRAAQITGTHPGDFRVTSDLLEDRMAMLTELRASVTELDNNFLEVMEYMRSSSRKAFPRI